MFAALQSDKHQATPEFGALHGRMYQGAGKDNVVGLQIRALADFGESDGQ